MKSFFSHTTYATDEPELPAKDKAEKRLLDDLKLTRAELEIAYSGFDNVTDPDLIDCYIYKVNAVLMRYKFLMEKAAELNIVNNPATSSGIIDSRGIRQMSASQPLGSLFAEIKATELTPLPKEE